MHRRAAAVLIATEIAALAMLARAEDYPLPGRRRGTNNQVAAVPPTPELIAALKVPSGFTLNVFARDLKNPRMIAVAPDGTVYVTQRNDHSVVMLRDANGDGTADDTREVVSGMHAVHGILIHDGTMYLAPPERVYAADRKSDGSVGEPRVIIPELAPGGRHENRTLGLGPDGKLYINVGSTCNACLEPNPHNATMLRANLDGSGLEVVMKGLRNTTGFGWHPRTNAMWGMDHGTDWLGNTVPPEELNLLVQGGDYGWPFCWGTRHVADIGLEPKDKSAQRYCDDTKPMVMGYDAHAAPIGMIFYTGDQFPAAYRNDAFFAMRGSWNREPASGYKIVRLRFDAAGKPIAFEDFVSGFLISNGTAQFARLAGVAQAKDGALLFSDDSNGVIYRVAYADSGGGEKQRK